MIDKPDIALALEGASKPPKGMLGGEAVESVEPVEETDPSLVEAAGAVKAAMSGGDDEEFAKTLKGFIKLCGEYS